MFVFQKKFRIFDTRKNQNKKTKWKQKKYH